MNNDTITVYVAAEHTPRAGYLSHPDFGAGDDPNDYQEFCGTKEELLEMAESVKRGGQQYHFRAARAIEEAVS